MVSSLLHWETFIINSVLSSCIADRGATVQVSLNKTWTRNL